MKKTHNFFLPFHLEKFASNRKDIQLILKALADFTGKWTVSGKWNWRPKKKKPNSRVIKSHNAKNGTENFMIICWLYRHLQPHLRILSTPLHFAKAVDVLSVECAAKLYFDIEIAQRVISSMRALTVLLVAAVVVGVLLSHKWNIHWTLNGTFLIGIA